MKKTKPRGRPTGSAPDGDFPKAGDESLGATIKRIDRKLLQHGLTDRGASVAAGHSADLIRQMRRQHQVGTQHGISPRVLVNLAKVFQTSPEWLLRGHGAEVVEGADEAPAAIAAANSRAGRGNRARKGRQTPSTASPNARSVPTFEPLDGNTNAVQFAQPITVEPFDANHIRVVCDGGSRVINATLLRDAINAALHPAG